MEPLENIEVLTTHPERITSMISKALYPSTLETLMSLNWTLLATTYPQLIQDLINLKNIILASNSPMHIKNFLILLLKSIFE